MKKILYTIAGCYLLTLSSCVDLNQEPRSFVTEEEYINMPQNIKTVELAATGLYKNMWNNNYGISCRLLRINCSADDMVTSPKPNNVIENFIRLSPVLSSQVDDWNSTWSNLWSVVTGANKLITGTPLPSNEEEAKKYKAVLAEAYFMRALSYFYMVRIFGDVPLITNPADAVKEQARVSVAEIYDKVILPDLTFATTWLPKQSRSGFSSTPSMWAAKALLADVYMTMAGYPLKRGSEYYSKAAEQTLTIIKESGLQLTTVYGDLWKEAKKKEANEHMFAIHNSVDGQTASQYGKSFYPRDFIRAGWADYYANPDFFAKYPEGSRKNHNYMLEWETAKGIVTWQNSQDKLPCIAKYQDYNQGPSGSNALSNGITPFYRYADVLLMYAEASNLATGQVNSEALKCLQDVQRRAGVTTITTTTDSKQFDDAVFAERGWEFFAEFKRWFDLVRREKVAEFKSKEYPSSFFKENNHFYFPIPDAQIKLTNWTNNPGY